MLEYLFDGGPLMIPLMLLSMLAVAVIIDRWRAFRAAAGDNAALATQVRDALDRNDVEGSIRLCEKSEGPVAAVLLAGLDKYRKMLADRRSISDIETSVGAVMADYAPSALSGLEQRLNLLVLIASVSPLLGMTGTVTGMIKSFDKMAEAAGLDPSAVAGGISEALLTTATGLLVAIPAVVAYSVFTRKLDEQTVEIESAMRDVADAISH